MSAALYRQAIEAWNAHDVDRFLGFCDPEVEFKSIITQVEGGAYHGHDGIRKYFADLDQTLGDLRLEVVQIEERGEWVIASNRGSGTGTASGAPLEWEFWQAVRYQDGLALFAVTENTRDAVLAAAGLE